MRVHAFDLVFSSPVTHLPTASGLFGHLAWWVRYTEGEGVLLALLERFEAAPPWLLSSSFPKGLLPRPILPPIQDERLKESAFRKRFKALRYLDFETFGRVSNEGEQALLTSMGESVLPGEKPSSVSVGRTRIGISREWGGAHEGILYTDALVQPQGAWTVYAVGSAEDAAWLEAGLAFIGESGYGGKASVGLGRFGVSVPYNVVLPEAEGTNAFTTLAPCTVPHARGFYALETHWGRLGGAHAHAETPFKRPYVRAGVGSTFYGSAAGGLLETAELENGRAVDYLYAFPLGVRLPKDGGFRDDDA